MRRSCGLWTRFCSAPHLDILQRCDLPADIKGSMRAHALARWALCVAVVPDAAPVQQRQFATAPKQLHHGASVKSAQDLIAALRVLPPKPVRGDCHGETLIHQLLRRLVAAGGGPLQTPQAMAPRIHRARARSAHWGAVCRPGVMTSSKAAA